MNVEIFGRDLEITDRLHDYVEKKASKLVRFLNSIQSVRVDLAHAKSARDPQDRYAAQITVEGKGALLRAEERTDDIRTAFDASLNKMQRQIARYKGKRYRGKGDGSSLSEEAMQEIDAAYQEEEPTEIVRRKKFFLNPMDELEAIEQMRLVGHEDFFVFYNMEANCVSVLYKRRDGNFGLIDTELA